VSALTWRPGLVAAVTRHAAWMPPPADAPPIDAARARAEQTCRARAAHAHAHLDVVDDMHVAQTGAARSHTE